MPAGARHRAPPSERKPGIRHFRSDERAASPDPRRSAMLTQIARRLAVASALLLVTVNIAAAQANYPVTVTDDAGVHTTFNAPPRRIVSLNPGHTETDFALGAGDRLVAVDAFSNYPVEAQQIQPRLTTYPTVSVETVIALKPDLVLALVENDDVLGQIRGQGVPVLKLLPKDFETTTREIAALGRVLGSAQRGDELAADMRARRDAVVEAVAGAPRPRVFYEMDASDPTKPFAAGPNGFYGQLVDLAGGSNIFARPTGRLRPGQRGERRRTRSRADRLGRFVFAVQPAD